MNKNLKAPLYLVNKWRVYSLFFLITVVLSGVYFSLALNQKVEADFEGFSEEDPIFSEFIVIQGNSFLPLAGHLLFEEKNKEAEENIKVMVTGYSSSPWETDNTPYITASGSWVKDGIVATNILPFGTKVKFPSLYGDKVFVVEDRMNPKTGYNVDIWFASRQEALNFGVRVSDMEIIREG
jgi:3D (Asp-Asp-Asp) domain-containing protein